MRTQTLLAALPLVAGCFTGNLSDAAWSGPPFSADIVGTREPTKAPAHIAMADGKMRIEGGDSTGHGVVVFDPLHHSTLFISDKNRTYIDAGMFTPLLAAGFTPVLRFLRPVGTGDPCAGWNSSIHSLNLLVPDQRRRDRPHFTCHALGAESVNGRPAQKWAVEANVDSESTTLWIDDRLHIVSKAVGRRSEMEMCNIHEGPQPAALFEAPPGYERLSVTTMLSKLGVKQTQSNAGSASPTPSTP